MITFPGGVLYLNLGFIYVDNRLIRLRRWLFYLKFGGLAFNESVQGASVAQSYEPGFIDLFVKVQKHTIYICRRRDSPQNLIRIVILQRRWRDIRERRLAVLMALHPRLGAGSGLGHLGRDMVLAIGRFISPTLCKSRSPRMAAS